MFNDIGVLVMLNFIEDNVDKGGFAENDVTVLDLNKVIEQCPYVFDEMRTETAQCAVQVDEYLCLQTIKVPLL